MLYESGILFGNRLNPLKKAWACGFCFHAAVSALAAPSTSPARRFFRCNS